MSNNNGTTQKIFYNGFDVILENCKYRIKGISLTFPTLDAVKKHIDWMKLDRPHKQNHIIR